MHKLCLSISVFLALCVFALAQTNTGAIVGTVTDTSSAVVPNAKVTVRNMDTNLTVKTTTDGSGNFVVTPVLVGRYSVSVEASGFKAEVRSGVTVDVQARVRADFVLQVGAVAETVEVRAANPLLQTDSSYVGQVMDTERIDDLPLNGRYLTRLAVLAPGATPETTGSKDAKTGGFSVNGLRPYQNTYLLDGVDNDNRQAGLTGGVDYVIGPPPDAVGEFKLQTNNMSTEFGTSAGAVMNVTIKSGTNQLHGDVFEFVRNSDFDAKNFFDSPTAPIPAYRLNQFGGTAGGPVYIPGLYDGRNKTFFFADYQGTRIHQGLTDVNTVPPMAWREGNLAGFQQIFDPTTTTVVNGVATRQPFPGNQILSGFDPAAVAMLKLIPLPNLPGSVGPSGVANNYLYDPVLTDDINQFDVRFDRRFSDKDTGFLRFSFQNEPELRPPALPIGDANFRNGVFVQQSRQAVATYTHIFTPRTINEFRAAYTYNYLAEQIFDYAKNGNVNEAAQLGIPGIPFASAAWPNGGTPAFFVSGLSSFGNGWAQPTIDGSTVFEFIDILSMVRGPHTLKVGAELYPRMNIPFLQPQWPRGGFTFNGDSTRDPNNLGSTGLGAASFLLGNLSQAQISDGVYDTFQQPGYTFFVQDDFKVTKKLTLNLGLRYQFNDHPMEKHNALANFDLATGALDIVKGRNDPLPAYFDSADIPVNRNAPRSLVPNQHLNFAPRAGFAYNIFPKTVVRGGYGIFWTFFEAGPLSSPNMGENQPFYQVLTYSEDSVTQPNPIVSQLSSGFPANALSTGEPGAPQGLFALDPHFRNPYEQVWNFGVQQELGGGLVWDIEYAGSKGTALYEFRNSNQASPTADPNLSLDSRRPYPFMHDDPSLWCSCGSSIYHALQTKLEKRFSNGLSFLAAYTYSKTIDEQSEASLGEGSGQAGFRWKNDPGWERGPADFDARHRFAFSYSYELPVGHGKRFAGSLSPAANAVLGGWQLVGADAFQTGLPLSVFSSVNESNSDGDSRPDVVLSIPLKPGEQGPNEWYNPTHFEYPAPGAFGNSGRDILAGPGLVELDFSLFKNFRISERFRLEFRSEFFNIVNHPNFQGNSIGDTFDLAGAGQLTAANPSRQIQFALKLYY
jgi:hypothetical protein